jgi:hypothetical protein
VRLICGMTETSKDVPGNITCQACGKGSLDHTDEEAQNCINEIVKNAEFAIDTFISPEEAKLLKLAAPNLEEKEKMVSESMDDRTRADNLLNIERQIISCQKELEALHEMKESLLLQKD